MRAHHSRRALRLASGLVAAGLALTAAPHALAADTGSGSGMRLTNTQADKLAERMQPDLYGDGGATADAGRTGADPGASTDASANITVTSKSSIENVHGYATTMPVDKKGDYFTLHSLAHVTRAAADGTERWSRSGDSLYADWGIKPLRVWEKELYPAHVVMGYNAVSPGTPNSDQGSDTGDLTGDGVPDVVFSAEVGINPPSGVVIPGTSMTGGTMVTVLDGTTGRTVWSKFFTYASQVKIVDGALLVADSPKYNQSAPAASTVKLSSFRFVYEDGRLAESSTWTYDTGVTGPAGWGALQDIGGGRAAVTWNLRKTATNASRGHTVVVDMNDGTVRWQTGSSLYARQLRVDAGRGQLVAVEQSDYTDGVRYELAAYDLADGRRTTLDTRVNVLPTALAVGDLSGGADAEYAVSESSLTDSMFVNASTIRVLDGGDPETALWQHTTKRDASNGHDGPSTWHLDVVGRKLVAAASDDRQFATAANVSRYGSLTVFSGKGKVRWQTKGATTSPMFQDVFSDRNGRHIRVVDGDQNVRTYAFGNGGQEQLTPLQGDMAYGASLDIDGDGKDDFVEGGTSHGIWAYSGTSLLDGKPKKLWRTTLPGSVHGIETADVTGNKTPEIVVATDDAVVVLDSKTGAILKTIDGEGQFVRSVTLADVDGDKKSEILVPTDKLRVYKGNGKALWTYAAPADAGDVQFSDPSTGDGKVYVQYTSKGSFDVADPAMRAVQLDARTGALGWAEEPKAPATALDGKVRGGLLGNAVYASPVIPYADGHAVVYTWVVWSPSGLSGADAFSPHNVMEIRDGRTGEVLHSAITGGLWTHSNYFDGDGVLLGSGTAAIYSFGADGDADSRVFMTPPTADASWITAPNGDKVIITSGSGGVYLWDPAVVTGDVQYPDYLGKAPTAGGARNYATGDFDGDGSEEAVMLNYDERGVNQAAELIGGGYYVPNDSTHCTITLKLS
ncbi:WD40 repeat domain-containing protein [Streptomyces sp. SID9124]|uniref:FG-GAP-like repeat-containing protein n=1 Tax=Streptomyces sp. SID9124 TaxID=2706108 RepID=UPI0013DEB285|nr:WD40 repeat domain-containing protein [Streptomyces sp. SID9124]NED14478.1 WD40 repeat domain-containing protein [Streptomyces sp. SID9124]